MSHAHSNKQKRKNFLIDKSFQLRCAVYFGGILLAAFCVVGVILYLGVWDGVVNTLTDGKFCEDFLSTQESDQPWLYAGEDDQLLVVKQAEKLSRNRRELAHKILQTVQIKLLPSCLALIILAGWLSIFLTHRIAGPIYRITKNLRLADGGDLRVRIQLRSKDEGHILADAINTTLSGFDMTATKLKRIIRKFESNPEAMCAALKEELSKLKTSGE